MLWFLIQLYQWQLVAPTIICPLVMVQVSVSLAELQPTGRMWFRDVYYWVCCDVWDVKCQECVDDHSRENHSALPVIRSAAKCAYGALDVLDFVSRLKQVYLTCDHCCFLSFTWYTLCLKKVPTFKLSVTLSNLNRFSKILHCWKLYEICYKTHTTLPIWP